MIDILEQSTLHEQNFVFTNSKERHTILSFPVYLLVWPSQNAMLLLASLFVMLAALQGTSAKLLDERCSFSLINEVPKFSCNHDRAIFNSIQHSPAEDNMGDLPSFVKGYGSIPRRGRGGQGGQGISEGATGASRTSGDSGNGSVSDVPGGQGSSNGTPCAPGATGASSNGSASAASGATGAPGDSGNGNGPDAPGGQGSLNSTRCACGAPSATGNTGAPDGQGGPSDGVPSAAQPSSISNASVNATCGISGGPFNTSVPFIVVVGGGSVTKAVPFLWSLLWCLFSFSLEL